MKLIPTLLLLAVINSTIAQSTKNFSAYFTGEKKYLVLPVKNGAPKKNCELWVDGVNVRFWDMELADAQADWYAYLQVDQWKGKQIELRVSNLAVNSKAFSPITQSDIDSNANEYREKLRAQFHFSPKRGWTNDPNGMVFYKGEYHLFFQHNPYGRGWGNMTWGHAISKDLIHWKELDDALHPDAFGPVFSGGAVVDSNNTSGLGANGNMPMVLFHTGAKAWAQNLSWSNDGRTFQSLTDRAVVARIHKDNRDPKVIWHAPTKKWVMVLWVERGDNEQHSMQFLTSPDLKNWTPTSIVLGGIGNDRYLFECPEFYELPVEGTNEKKWVLTGANTQYAIGNFDGITFTPTAERLQGQHGRDFYAPQTFSDDPTGRRIEIGWWRTHTDKDGMGFNQSMSIPLEHKLVQTNEGIRLTRMPVKELEQLRAKTYRKGNLSLQPNGANPLKDIDVELLEMRMEIEPGKASSVVMDVRGVAVTYNVASAELVVDGVKAPVPLVNGKLDLIIFADRTGVEIFANKGLVFMPVNINIAAENRRLGISVVGGKVKISNLVVYELKSIWE